MKNCTNFLGQVKVINAICNQYYRYHQYWHYTFIFWQQISLIFILVKCVNTFCKDGRKKDDDET